MASEIVVHKPKWNNDLIPLVCGIANAGGGSLVLAADTKKPVGIRKLRKPMETIPSTLQNALGINCTVEPIMDGVSLCLEVTIPASNEPIKYGGSFYLYRNHQNEVVTESEVIGFINREEAEGRLSAPASGTSQQPTNAPKHPSAPAKAASKKPADFTERSVAAANDIYLTLTDEYILKILRTNGRATAQKMALALSVSESTVRRSFKRLKDEGFIERVGSKKAGYWKVLK